MASESPSAGGFRRSRAVLRHALRQLRYSLLWGFVAIAVLAAAAAFFTARVNAQAQAQLRLVTDNTVVQALGAAHMSRLIGDVRLGLVDLRGQAVRFAADAGDRDDALSSIKADRRNLRQALAGLKRTLIFTKDQARRGGEIAAQSGLPRDVAGQKRELELLSLIGFHIDALSDKAVPLTRLSVRQLLKTDPYVKYVITSGMNQLDPLVESFANDTADELRTESVRRSADALHAVQVATSATAIGIGVVALVLGIFISRARKRSDRSLAESEERFRSIVETTSEWIWAMNLEGRLTYSNPAIETMLGYSADELLGTEIMALMHEEDRQEVVALLPGLVESKQGWSQLVTRWRHAKDGSYRHLESTAVAVIDAMGHVIGFRGADRDVTERIGLQRELAHQAFHDPLTGLANRTLFAERTEQALEESRRSNRLVALLFADLDNFKSVNDTLGHSAGDDLLRNVAERLERTLRPEDTLARLGGDEFAILLEDVDNTKGAQRVAERIVEALSTPFSIQGKEVQAQTSIGLAVGRAEDHSSEELLRNADVAMYVAKSSGKSQHRVFEVGMHAEVLHRAEIESDLRQALERNQFCLYYQPIIDLLTNSVTGVEALLRWDRPDRGLVAPPSFIPLLEESGQIVPVGAWILDESCRQARRLQDMFPGDPPLTMSVNLSVRELQHAGLMLSVSSALERSKLSPRTLVLEITESILMTGQETRDNLARLKELGIHLAIDDFGTGYSSLGYLQHVPADILKIDKSFVDDVGRGTFEDSALARAIISLGDTLGLRTVAEGVERVEQLAELVKLGCRWGQGYYFAKPLDVDSLEDFLRRNSATGRMLAHPADAQS
jgi:diguanylate cyclase (GGDEF)-like protein/PAS domain S-box-containing protein